MVPNIKFHFYKFWDCPCFILGAVYIVAWDGTFVLLSIDSLFLYKDLVSAGVSASWIDQSCYAELFCSVSGWESNLDIQLFFPDFCCSESWSNFLVHSSWTFATKHLSILDWWVHVFNISTAFSLFSSLVLFATHSAEYPLAFPNFLALR